MSYCLNVEYPGNVYFTENLDSDIIESAGVDCDGSGYGFDIRDLGFTFDSAEEANAAAERVKQLHKEITTSVFEMEDFV